MKKPASQKQSDQAAKAARELADKTASWHIACRKIGIAVRMTFVRKIKEAMKCETDEAESVFEVVVSAGEIEFVCMNNAGDVSFYRMKSV